MVISKAAHELVGHQLPVRCPLAISLLVSCVSRCSTAPHPECISLSNISFGGAKVIAVLSYHASCYNSQPVLKC